MSYLIEETWLVRPTEAFKILRNCPKCGTKTLYGSTGNFRVNANGKNVDIWLIYQCETCKSTYNLPVYERVRSSQIEPELYRKFMENDAELALKTGVNRALFERSRAVVCEDATAIEIVVEDHHNFETGEGRLIRIINPFHLKLRLDRILARQLECSRSSIKRAMLEGDICCEIWDRLEI